MHPGLGLGTSLQSRVQRREFQTESSHLTELRSLNSECGERKMAKICRDNAREDTDGERAKAREREGT